MVKTGKQIYPPILKNSTESNNADCNGDFSDALRSARHERLVNEAYDVVVDFFNVKRCGRSDTILLHKSVATTPHPTSRSQHNHPPPSLYAPLPYIMAL